MSVNEESWSRRKFLKTAGAAGMAALLTGADFRASSAAEDSEKTPLPVRRFGKTGVSVPMLGFGGSQNLMSKQRLLRQAVKLGVTYWDTAESYGGGSSEESMGNYLKQHPEDRKRIFLVSKANARHPAGLSKSLDASLERLNTSTIDLYLVHAISSPEEMSDDIRVWAEKEKARGRVRFIGFSAHSNMEQCMLGAATLGWIDGIMVTYNYRLMNTDQMKRAVDACAGAGVGLTAMKTQGGWSWRRSGADSPAPEQLIGRFTGKGFSEAQARLLAVWENPRIACICSEMTNLKMLTENVAAAQKQTGLSLEDRRMLNRYAHETASEYCAGCTRICESAMDYQVPVGDTMRHLMYARCYGEPERAETLFRRTPQDTRLKLETLDFAAAEKVCPRRMPIGKLMREAAAELV